MSETLLDAERDHLASLLEAVQRCVYFLDAAARKLDWPLAGATLAARKKDTALFETLAAINERFAKLQDTVGAAMRHALPLLGESADSFLKVLVIYEKAGVVASVADWQLCRTARNLAAHEYEIRHDEIAAHFNALHGQLPFLYATARNLVALCAGALAVVPASADYAAEFDVVTATGIA